MMTIEAPYPGIVTTTYLPNPQFNNSLGNKPELLIKRTMNGNKRTYVKTNTRKSFTLTWVLTRMKAIELKRFIDAYYRNRMLVTFENGDRYIVHALGNPFEFTSTSRAGGWPGSESSEVTLEFEGVQDVPLL